MQRPMPPASMTDLSNLEDLGIRVCPAPEVLEWINEEILADTGSIHNPDHAHLIDADIAVMWASSAFRKQGRTVIGQAELVAFRAGGWQKARAEQQMMDWFGRVPTFIITLAADFCSQCGDADFCALVEHEMFHIAQKIDEFGAPKFSKDGMPSLEMRGHDVSEFVAVVERYGVGAPNSDVARMVDAAKTPPSVSQASIAQACGTCMLRSA